MVESSNRTTPWLLVGLLETLQNPLASNHSVEKVSFYPVLMAPNLLQIQQVKQQKTPISTN